MPKLKFDWSPIKDVQKINTLLARLLEGLLWRAARQFSHAIRRDRKFLGCITIGRVSVACRCCRRSLLGTKTTQNSL